MNERAEQELAVEQAHLELAYATLDDRTSQTRQTLSETAKRRTSHAQNRLENEALAENLVTRLASYEAAQRRLCFGRIDTIEGAVHHVGRIGLSNDNAGMIQIDWRAPAAAAFYQATPANPAGLIRRRHIATDGRRVTAIADDVFDDRAVSDDAVLSSDGVLLAALQRERTGKMGDIVETIQAEQDAIVRSDARGVLVVDGGPGTGKTVVALHRAAYLLYRDRQRLERSGVLIIGPTSRFLTYIDDVLPGLGETGVVLATIADLFPGIEPRIIDLPATLAVKADARMADVIARAVLQLRRIPPQGCTLQFGKDRVHLSERFLAGASRRALQHDSRHNPARPVFISAVVQQVIDELARKRGVEVGDPHERAELFDEINQTPDARRAINLLWMPVTAEQLVGRLWRDPARLKRAADRILTEEEQILCFRSRSGWSIGDVAILDEAAELLGPTGIGDPRMVSYDEDLTELGAGDDLPDFAELADRALHDREWVYGHVIVDEAQELTPMQWRMLARKAPSKSMTVVGDLAQASTPGACRSWEEALDPIAKDRWRKASLSVNYRTPASICALADRYRSAYAPITATRAVRDNGTEPVFVETTDDVRVTRELLADLNGLGMVITARSNVGRYLAAGVPAMSAAEAKGLEFDNAVVVDPAAIEREHGSAGLYVALTRPTQWLAVVHAGDLPNGLVA